MAKGRVRRKAQRQLNKQTLISMATVSFVVLALLVVVSIKGIELREKNASYEQTKASLMEQIAREEQRAREIEAYSEYVNSHEYVEKIAKERLGLINQDEIIFYSEEDGTPGNVTSVIDSEPEEESTADGYTKEEVSVE